MTQPKISIDDILKATKEMKLKEALYDLILDETEKIITKYPKGKETVPYFTCTEYQTNHWLVSVIDRRHPPAFKSTAVIYFIEGDELKYQRMEKD